MAYLNRFIIISILQIFVVVANAQSTNFGFYKPTNPSIPVNIRAAANSVFEIRISPPSDNSIELDLTSPDSQKRIAGIIETMKAENFDELDLQIFNKQIEACKALKEEKECIIHTEFYRASGFLIENDGAQILITNAHVIESLYKFTKNILVKKGNTGAEKDIQALFDKNVIADFRSIYIFNSKGKMVYDTSGNDAALIYLPELTPSAVIRQSFYGPDSDMAGIELSRKIGKPLKMAKALPQEGDQIYLIGFPYCTNCSQIAGIQSPLEVRSRGIDKDSDGRSQYITTGQILEQQTALNFFDLGSISKSKFYNLKRLLFYTADSQYGLSGGALLNKNGEVFGAHTGGTSKSIDGQHVRYSRGVSFKDLAE